ncbi:hypothetical protein SAY86_027887 [Trapa natans]|uniref:procollagen-proline 4-dioxygenase n=1 Tax=Trapa natans TaxID=22666 RepID=A0AAN7MGE6_TRANT|nr:hypothetical protein SAY86_027887 [Trapa natans]
MEPSEFRYSAILKRLTFIFRSLWVMVASPKMAKGKYPRVQALRVTRYRAVLLVSLGLTVAFVVLLALGIVSLPIRSQVSRTIHFNPINHFTPVTAPRRRASEPGSQGLGERGKQWTQVLSWEPRAFLYHNFLSKEECEYLISLAKPRLAKSTVVNDKTGGSLDSQVRTSNGMFLSRGQDKIVRAIEKRIADFTFVPVENGEGLQILHYEFGQKYEPHFDYFSDPFNTKNGGQRMATMLMYLSDVEEGGETVFPNANANFSSVPWWDELSECGKKGLSVKPKMGNAVLFWSTKPDGTVDPASLHGSCPVIKGDKWSAPKWMRLREYKV